MDPLVHFAARSATAAELRRRSPTAGLNGSGELPIGFEPVSTIMNSDQLPLPLDRGFRPTEPKPQSGVSRRLAAAGVLLANSLKGLLGSAKSWAGGITALTMGISICAYAVKDGWAFAGVFVLLLFCHELGHVWAAKRLGLPVSAPVFIPFVGAAITMKRNPKAAAHEAYLAVGGPLTGTLAALATLTVGWAVGSDLLVGLALLGFVLNFLNLIPLHPLDGGRLVAAVSPWLWLVGVLVMVPLLVLVHAWFIGPLIGLMAWPNLKRLFVGRDRAWRVYYTCTRRQRLYASGAWVFLGTMLVSLTLAVVIGQEGVIDLPVGMQVAGLAAAWFGLLLLSWVCFYTWPLKPAGRKRGKRRSLPKLGNRLD